MGVLTGDLVTVFAVLPVFADKNVGTGKSVTANLEITGDQARNYTLKAGQYSTRANISALDITGSFTAADKVYNGLEAASVLSTTLTTPIFGDVVELSITAAFADRHVGTGKPVSAGAKSLKGGDAGN